ncbi:acyl-CoA dehydrogenase family protein [Qaidamihabitans albus]|uniref:acyl-CoA dehydrogenase family protein n=1 Tax=Qaidamihabitans albus TaxID=2795733 RepID=UPI0018F1CE1F|nr:acyl-CoA dehydrogenase family protein [Qaidamihabitans albus]
MTGVAHVLPSAVAVEGARALDEALTRLVGGRPIADYAVSGVDGAWDVLRSGGWDRLAAGEEDDGFGLPLRDLVEIAQVLGSHLVPIPVTTSIVLRGPGGYGDGHDRPLAVAVTRRSAPVRARVVYGGYPDVAVPNLPGDVEPKPCDGFAPTLRMAAIEVPAGSLGAEVRRWLSVLWAAEAVGSAGRLLREAVAYAKVREQFGQPIGRFQAVKHLLADSHLAHQEGLTATVWAANEAGPAPQALRLVFRRCLVVSESATQVFGGIGMTWELGLHFHTRHMVLLRDLTEDLLTQGRTPRT